MAEDQENEVESEEELDIDALLDDVADGGPAEGEEAVGDIDAMLDEVDEAEAAPAPEEPMEEAFEEMGGDDLDVMMDQVAEETPEEAPTEPEPAVEPPAAASPAPAPAPAAAPAAVPAASSAELDGVVSRLAAIVDRAEAAIEKSEQISQQLEERHSAAERFVKGVKAVSQEMKEERPSLAKVEKSSNLGMILGGAAAALAAAVLGLTFMEDKEALPMQVETVSASVDGVSENVNLIAGRIFEQQQQMDEAMSSFASLKEALEKLPQQPAAPVAPVMAEGSEDAGMGVEKPEVSVDFTVVEEKIDETQQKIIALQELLKGSEARLPEMKKHLEQLVAGQLQLKQEQDKLMQLQQMMMEAKQKGLSIYKFP